MAFLQVESGCCGSSLESSSRMIAIVMLIFNFLNYPYIAHQYMSAQQPLWLMILQLCTTSLGVLIHILLLHGSNKRNAVLLLPWLVTVAFVMVIMVIAVPVLTGLTIYIKINNPLFSLNYVIAIVLVCAFFLAIYTYLFALVLSFYRELKDEQNRGGILPTKSTEVPHHKLKEERDPNYPPVYPGLAQQLENSCTS